ncbi:DUF4198 domain-containing protein [Pararhizobium sp. IMCC21322]|uniref:DUF4198 domain-containing protein n=1 Tax=Pararhizobium sp. IMCC21322 TaxID=3067903 RepID=UPI00274277DC|nr:DUF4198 domain-containing protein [Pararhizobium sp. IMCC21322]
MTASIEGTLAHEFWIEPDTSQIAVGEGFTATLNVGQDLSGSTYSYLPPRFERFTITAGGSTKPVESRVGDNPALQMRIEDPGLQIIAYQSKIEGLTYASPEKFQQFLDYEGLDWVLDTHKERGLPSKNFRENYTRFAKSLVQVGPYKSDGSSADQAVGLPIELVAMNSPFEPGRERLEVQLLRSGLPLENIQIATFQRNIDGSVSRRLTRSDANGIADILIDSGGFFLVSAVQMEAIDPKQSAEAVNGRIPVWQSLWASLSFRLQAD